MKSGVTPKIINIWSVIILAKIRFVKILDILILSFWPHEPKPFYGF